MHFLLKALILVALKPTHYVEIAKSLVNDLFEDKMSQ
jgi:hypothetical protein